MDVLLKDVIKIISGLLIMQATSSRPNEIKSIDGALEHLILTKDHFQVAYKMYKGDLLPDNKSAKFLAVLRLARENIGKAIETFDKDLVIELKRTVSSEFLKEKKGKQ